MHAFMLRLRYQWGLLIGGNSGCLFALSVRATTSFLSNCGQLSNAAALRVRMCRRTFCCADACSSGMQGRGGCPMPA